jgi:hypothetical protein
MLSGAKSNHVRGAAHHRWRGGSPLPDPEKRRANAKASAARYPERRRAREKVKDAIRRGDIPPAKDRVCVVCAAPARQYDHHLGYEFPLAVEPVCFACHGRRSRARGEHRVPHVGARKRAAGDLLDGRQHHHYPA